MTLPGTGAVVAADDVSSAYFQRVKLDVGADGLSVPVEGALPVTLATAPLPTGASSATNQAAAAVLTGAVDETAPVSDTASSGLNGRLQRIAQRITTQMARLPAALGQTTKDASLSVTLASNQEALPLPTGAATAANQTTAQASLTSLDTKQPALGAAAAAASIPVTLSSDGVFVGVIGAAADAAVVTDATGTASGKLRGLVKWAFERMPASLGQKAMAASLPVVVASDQSAVPVSGTFWQATQPVSGTVTANAGTGTLAVSAASLPLPSGAATLAKQPALGTAGTASADVLTVQGVASMTPLTAGGLTRVVAVTFSLDTSAYASGDLLADTQVVSSTFRANDGTGVLQSIVLNDKDDQGVAMTIVLLDANVSLGTENSAPSITDANADNILATIAVAAADWLDLGGCRVAFKGNLGIPVKAVSGAATLYIGLINGTGAPTFTASGITARLGLLSD